MMSKKDKQRIETLEGLVDEYRKQISAFRDRGDRLQAERNQLVGERDQALGAATALVSIIDSFTEYVNAGKTTEQAMSLCIAEMVRILSHRERPISDMFRIAR